MSGLWRRKELICSIVRIRGGCLNHKMLSLRKLKVGSESWWTQIVMTMTLLTLQVLKMVIQRGDTQTELLTMALSMPPVHPLRRQITRRSVLALQHTLASHNPSGILPIRIKEFHLCVQMKIQSWHKGQGPQPGGL